MLEQSEGALRSERFVMQRPTVIRLITYVRVPRDAHRRKITRKAVLARDSWTCQYCGSRKPGPDGRPRDPPQPRRQIELGKHRRLLRPLQPPQGQPPPPRDQDAPEDAPGPSGPDGVHLHRRAGDPPGLAAVPAGLAACRQNDRGRPEGRPPSIRCGYNEIGISRTGGTFPRPPLLAGARVGFRRAAHTACLAALHLRCPENHVTQVRTTSFLRSLPIEAHRSGGPKGPIREAQPSTFLRASVNSRENSKIRRRRRKKLMTPPETAHRGR